MEWVLTWKQIAVVLALVLWLGYSVGAARWRRRLDAAEEEWRQQVLTLANREQ